MWWKSPYGYSKLCDINTHERKLIHCMAVFTILYGNYYPPHEEFELICIGKFAIRTWVNFTQQYGKNRQRCQQNKFTMLYGNYCYIFIENFPQKFSPCEIDPYVRASPSPSWLTKVDSRNRRLRISPFRMIRSKYRQNMTAKCNTQWDMRFKIMLLHHEFSSSTAEHY